MIPRRVPASIARTCCCWCSGKKPIARLTVSVASRVCIVESTRWPVSAALRAVSMVTRSRISPIMITSGSCRSTRRRALANESVSRPDLALVDQRAAVDVEHLDRVLDRHDVLVRGPVDPVDHRREGRALARAGRAGDEDDPALLVGEPRHDRRQLQVVDREHPEGHDAQHDADRAALAEDVDAEAPEPLAGVREVGLAGLLELGPLGVVAAQELVREARGVGRGRAARCPGIGSRSPLTRTIGRAGTFRCRSLAPRSTAWARRARRSGGPAGRGVRRRHALCFGTSRGRP